MSKRLTKQIFELQKFEKTTSSLIPRPLHLFLLILYRVEKTVFRNLHGLSKHVGDGTKGHHGSPRVFRQHFGFVNPANAVGIKRRGISHLLVLEAPNYAQTYS